MRDVYSTLTGERLDLASLTPQERSFLGQATRAFQEDESYPAFVNRVNAPGSPALGGGNWVTEEIVGSTLYRVCQDLANRLAVRQGYLALGPNSSTERPEPDSGAPELISCEDAARRIGVSGEAIRKAVRNRRIPVHQRIGRSYVLSAHAVEAFAARSGHEIRNAVAESTAPSGSQRRRSRRRRRTA